MVRGGRDLRGERARSTHPGGLMRLRRRREYRGQPVRSNTIGVKEEVEMRTVEERSRVDGLEKKTRRDQKSATGPER